MCAKLWGSATALTSSTTARCSLTEHQRKSFIMKAYARSTWVSTSGSREASRSRGVHPSCQRPGARRLHHEALVTAQAISAPDTNAAAAAVDSIVAAVDARAEPGDRALPAG